jgi:hypothetical protein
MASNPTLSPALNADWVRSTATTPVAIAPHPPLASGPGRMPLNERAPKSAGLAFVLGMLFGPVGLCYVSVMGGVVATALTAVTLLVAEAGFVPLLVIWPLAVLGSVWGAGRVRASG